MSKIIYLCFKDKRSKEYFNTTRVFELLSERLTPDNIIPNPVRIIQGEGIIAGIINPVKSIMNKGVSVCLGVLLKPYDKWYVPLTENPDGNYALIRGDNNTVEVVTDVVASRTIWYYFDKDMFIASTSQRAIVMLLRSFSFNKSVISWLITSGTLGYGNSWDCRIKKMKGDSRLVLNRNSWKINIYETPVVFEAKSLSKVEAMAHMRSVYVDTFNRLELTPSKWLLALSGGHDSRLVFLLLKDKIKLQCVTWGYKTAINDKLNDAYIAKKTAEYYGCNHQFYEVETKEEYIEKSLTRILISGEGRTDTILAHMDAFNSWKSFFEMGIDGIFRGDQGSIGRAIINEVQGRRLEDITILSDYKDYYKIAQFGFEQGEIHNDLRINNYESLISYSFRLQQMYRLPYKTAAWTDIVAPYVEVINPLLTRNIIYEIRKLPDNLLYMKNLHRSVVENMSPPIEFAKLSADESIRKVLYNPHLVRILINKINENRNDQILNDEFLSLVINNIHTYGVSGSNLLKLIPFHFLNFAKKMISTKNKHIMSAYIKESLEFNKIALRCYIILNMYNILQEDARFLNAHEAAITKY